MEFLHSDMFLILMLVLNLLMIAAFIFAYFNMIKLRKNYTQFMKKLGNGDDIEEILKDFIVKVDNIEQENEEIKDFIYVLNERVNGCFQKTGMVRYNAFKDTGSNLSFALAILDKNNDGVVLNGIYSRDISNIYAKPVFNGKSEYKLSDEEVEAIIKAINNNKKSKN